MDFNEFDTELKNEFGIADDLPVEGDVSRTADQPDLSKEGFVKAQIQQLQLQCFRLRCDIYVSYVTEADTDQQKLGKSAKIAGLRDELRSYSAQLAGYLDIQDALSA